MSGGRNIDDMRLSSRMLAGDDDLSWKEKGVLCGYEAVFLSLFFSASPGVACMVVMSMMDVGYTEGRGTK